MVFSYNWLQSFFESKLPKSNKLAELLTMHSFEVEGIKKKGEDALLDIDVLPNRSSDCLSHLGVAKEIAAIIGKKIKIPPINLKENKSSKSKDFIKVEVRSKKDCSRYTARVIENIKVGPSPKWIREKIEACGLQSINNIVDIANYVMLETGQPLHAFDFDKIKSVQNQKYKSKLKNIIVRRAKKGEKIITLDNGEYSLDRDILAITDEENLLAIAGIKGGKKAEIKKETKTIVLESANFNYLAIRRASWNLGLKTDASWRFENEIDPNLTKEAIDRTAYLIQKIAEGKIASGIVDFYPKKRVSGKINLDPGYVRNLLGIDIKDKEVKDILKRLNFEVKKKGKVFEVKIPTRRLDLLIAEDLVEEVGRLYGFQKIPAVFPIASLIPPKKNFSIYWENIIKNILKEAGFTEVYNYSFIGEKKANAFGYKKGELVELENPLSLDYKYLRPSLIPNLLKNLRENSKNFKDINIFELGKIFTPNNKQLEKKVLSVLSTNSDFYTFKGIVDLLLNKLGISEIWYDDFKVSPEESKKNFWEEGRRAEIKVASQEIGFLGEISPEILKKMKINRRVVLFDINFEELQKLCSEEQEYQPISQYPSAVRDIAVLVPAEVRVEEVLNKINIVGRSLIRDIDLFDIYEGKPLPINKKSFAFHIIYQAKDRTLSAKEIDALQQKIVEALEKNPEWEIRR